MRLLFCLALGGIFSCKPVDETNRRSLTPGTAKTGKAAEGSQESSIKEWTGRADLKLGWTFEDIP